MAHKGSSVIVLAALLSLCGPGRGQAQTTLVVLVDGSVIPTQIPDDLAWQHFFLAVAAHPNPTAQEFQRQKAQLAPLGLLAADCQRLVSILAKMQTQLDAIQSSMELTSPTDSAALAALKAQYSAMIAETIAAVKSGLTAEGLSSLSAYITTTVKKNIVIYGTSK